MRKSTALRAESKNKGSSEIRGKVKKSSQSAHQQQMSKYDQPFLHFHIPNFLNPAKYAQLLAIYNKLEFKEKWNDLFRFFQTNELANYQPLEFFKEELDRQFWKLEPMASKQINPKNTFYNIFASYYFKDNYLLCHDDVIEDRKYAFSYYLEDHPSGELVLFNNKADREIKRIKVKKNTLVIFEVSDISYHEVAICNEDGRKAVTGWFNIKDLSQGRVEKVVPPFIPSIPKNCLKFPLSDNYTAQQYFQLYDIQYQFNVTKETAQGPFYCRKVTKLEIDPPVVFEIDGYKLYSADFYRFGKGDYLLLNDPVNSIDLGKNTEIIDIFVTSLGQNFEVDEDNLLIKIVDENEELTGIPEKDDSLFIVKRGKKTYYVERNQKEFTIAHMIYIKISQSSTESKKTKKTKQVKKQPKPNRVKQLAKSSKQGAKKNRK